MIGLLIIILVFFGILAYSSFSWGFLTMKLINWFLIPVLATNFNIVVDDINLTQAIGLFFITIIFKYINYDDANINNTEAKKNKIITIIIHPWLMLGIAYLFKAWFM